MINEERLLKILKIPHISEKTSSFKKKNNVVVFKVTKNTTKKEIINSINKLFNIVVNDVHTLIVKGKTKRHGRHIGCRSDWKKAYISLRKDQNINIMGDEQ